MKRKTRGDVIRINIVPPGTSFPWIRMTRHDFGIKAKGTKFLGSIDAVVGKSRETVAKEIGEFIIANSKVLSDWFK